MFTELELVSRAGTFPEALFLVLADSVGHLPSLALYPLSVNNFGMSPFPLAIPLVLFCPPLPLIRTLVITLVPVGSTKIISTSPGQLISNINSIWHLHSPFATNVTYSQVRGTETQTSLGEAIILPSLISKYFMKDNDVP